MSDTGWSYSNQDEWIQEHGRMQSPININTLEVLETEFGCMDIKIDPRIVNMEKKKYSMNARLSGYSMIAGRRFNVDHIHFHTPAEHTIDGKLYAMEGHIVHRGIDGRLAVIGILFEERAENLVFQSMLESLDKGLNKDSGVAFDAILPSSKSYYHYIGSLTTQPLSENVEWYVLSNPITVSDKQLEVYKILFGDNTNRQVQALNNRVVIFHK